MKKIIIGLCLFFGATTAFSQELGYGLSGGLNYAMGGQIITGNDSGLDYWNGTAESEGSVGFQGGIFVQVNFGKFFIRPEIKYASMDTEFEIPINTQTSTFSVERFSVPVLFGYNIYGPIDIYAGPVYSNILDAKIEGEEDNKVVTVVQDSPINAQIGAKVEFGRFGLDIRYEHSLSTAKDQEINFNNSLFGGPIGGANRATFEDATLNQIIVSVIFKFGGPGLSQNRGRPCY